MKKKMQIVIDNYFKQECDINTSIRGAFEKGFRIGVKKGQSAQSEPTQEIQDILDYLNTVLHPIVSPEHWDVYSRLHDMVSSLPSAQPKYEPVTAEDFAKVMSESTIYGFMAWYGEVLALMKRMGFVICKKT